MRLFIGLFLATVSLVGLSRPAAEDAPGKKLFVENKCTQCHAVISLGLKAIDADTTDGDAAPDLSKLKTLPKSENLQAFLMKKEELNGKKHSKKFKGTPEELKVISDWIISLNGKK